MRVVVFRGLIKLGPPYVWKLPLVSIKELQKRDAGFVGTLYTASTLNIVNFAAPLEILFITGE